MSTVETSPPSSRRGSMMAAVRTLQLAKKWTKSFKSRRQSVLTTASSKKEPIIPMENTYKLTPDEGKEIKTTKMQKALEEMLERHLASEKYGAIPPHDLTKGISHHARRCVKQFELPRYKFVCHVILGEKTGQSVANASRCVWDENTDSFASASYQNATLFCIVTAYGAYLA